MRKQEEIGIWWFEHEFVDGDQKQSLWWGVCKKTKKISFASLMPIAPYIISATHIHNNECFDSDCLNVDCEFCKCKTLQEAMSHTVFKEIGIDQQRINLIHKVQKIIDKQFEELDNDERKEHFIDGYDDTSISAANIITSFV